MEKIKKYVPAILTLIVSLGMLVVFTSYAFFEYYRQGKSSNNLTTGYLNVEMDEGSSISIDNSNAYPVSDTVGANTTPYTFKLSNTGVGAVDYTIKVINDTSKIETDGCSSNLLDHTLIKAQLKKDGTVIAQEFLSNLENNFYTSVMNVNESSEFELRIWIDSSADNTIMGKHYHGKVSIIMSQHVDNQTLLTEKIFASNKIIKTPATLTTTSTEANENGLYVSTDTNSGNPTYFFRGTVENNYVSFANQTWRIVRINEDGTVRLILDEGINDNAEDYVFDSDYRTMEKMYYTNAEIKSTVDTWYNDNLTAFDNYIATSTFCEEMRVAYNTTGYTAGNATFVGRDGYTPTYKCKTDGNGYGKLQLKVGLITMDEEMFAGAFGSENNYEYFLHNKGDLYEWTMSPAGVYSYGNVTSWGLDGDSWFGNANLGNSNAVRPVISLKADVSVTGTGTSTDPYTVS